MEFPQSNMQLTSAEISHLWTAYMSDSGTICHLEYELNKVEDVEIKQILQYSLEVSRSHIEEITKIFNEENHPIPYGFSVEKDVDVTAPRLFSDTYFLNTLNQLGKIGLNHYSVALPLVTRNDIYHFFSTCLSESDRLIKLTNDVLLSKGIYVRPPYLPKPETHDFVKKQSFLSGFFGEKRPLIGTEITNLFANFQRNALGSATMLGYSQVAQDKEVVEYLIRGKEIAQKHCDIFESHFKENDLSTPVMMDSEVTDSTTYVYSDKKMMFYSSSLIALSIGYYGASMSMSPRRDIGVTYSRLIAEIAKYADDGAKLMIKNGWMEEPPRAVDRDELAKNN